MSIADIMTREGLARSKGEARRLATQGGVSVNGVKIADVDQLAPSGRVEVRVGQRRLAVIEVKQ